MASSNGVAESAKSVIDSITSQAASLASTLDDTGRKALIDGLRDLSISLETNYDTAQRLLYSQYPLMGLRLGCDLKLFDLLGDAPKPLTVDEISAKTGVAPTLLARLLRYMSSVRLIKETRENEFTANNVTKTFTIPGFQGGVYHYFDYIGPGVKYLPDYLKERNYKDIESISDSPLPKAWGSDLPLFLHYPTQPALFEHFNRFMVAQRTGVPTWLSVFPYQQAAKEVSPEQPFFVDVGGGMGHQSIALRDALPDLPNRIIVEDIAATLKQATPHPGVEFLEQDFYKPQQIKGAKYYYMRNILHDYPDDKALDILKNLRDAMPADGAILIDDMYLEPHNVHWQATQIDITMMIALSSIERTSAQWESLIPKAGLKIKKVHRYTESLRDSIIECTLA